MVDLVYSDVSIAVHDLRPFLTGRWDLMGPHHWGVIAGILTFTVTVVVVFLLLTLGGTWTRIAEQQKDFEVKGPAAFKTPFQRFLLYDELLEASKAMPTKPPHETIQGRGHSAGVVELRPYDAAQHLADLHRISCGDPVFDCGLFDPEEAVWRFLDDGPFASASELGASPLLAGGDGGDGDSLPNGRRFVLVDVATGYVVGCCSLLDNCPGSLRVRIGDIWLCPAFQRSHVHTAAAHALLAHLFSDECRYRRVECWVDAGDARGRRAAEHAGFSLEGILRKHRVVRGANSDTAMFSVTNSDWRDGGGEARLAGRIRPAAGISEPTRRPHAIVGKKAD